MAATSKRHWHTHAAHVAASSKRHTTAAAGLTLIAKQQSGNVCRVQVSTQAISPAMLDVPWFAAEHGHSHLVTDKT